VSLVKLTTENGRVTFVRAADIKVISEVNLKHGDKDVPLALLRVKVNDQHSLELIVQEEPQRVAELVIATEVYGSLRHEDMCDVSASTLGNSADCEYPKGHQGHHSWEKDVGK
jgi:hypothetical protein